LTNVNICLLSLLFLAQYLIIIQAESSVICSWCLRAAEVNFYFKRQSFTDDCVLVSACLVTGQGATTVPIHSRGGCTGWKGAAALHPIVTPTIYLDRVLLAPGIACIGLVVGGWAANLKRVRIITLAPGNLAVPPLSSDASLIIMTGQVQIVPRSCLEVE